MHTTVLGEMPGGGVSPGCLECLSVALRCIMGLLALGP